MKKLITILLLWSGVAMAQTTPVSPIQLTTNTPYLEPSTGLHWYYNGVTYLWYKALGVKDSTYYITPSYFNTHAAPIGSGVTKFNTRTGDVVPLTGDYAAFYPILAGSYVNPSWITSLAWSKITSTPTTLSGYGITDAQPLITAGTTPQYYRGDKTFQTLNTAAVPELTNLYYTNERGIGSTLTGYVSGAGTVSASDNILQAIQKLNGNIGALVTGVSSFNTRTGAVTLTSGDVTVALGFTPAPASGSANYITNNSSTAENKRIYVSQSIRTDSDTYARYANLTGSIISAPTPTGSNIILGRLGTANSFGFKGANNFLASISANNLTAGRSYTLPNYNGTFATLDSALNTNKNLFDVPNKTTALLNLGAAPATLGGGYVQNGTSLQASSNYNIDGLATITKASIGTTPTDALLLTQTTAATLGNQKISPSLHFNGNAWNTTGSASESSDFYNYLVPVQAATPTANLLWRYARAGGALTTAMTLSSAGNLTATGTVAGANVTATANVQSKTISLNTSQDVDVAINNNYAGFTGANQYMYRMVGAFTSIASGAYTGVEFNVPISAGSASINSVTGFSAKGGALNGNTVAEYNGFVAENSLTQGVLNNGFKSNITAGTGRRGFNEAGGALNSFMGHTMIGANTETAGQEALQVTGPASISTSLLLGTSMTLTTTPTTSVGGYDFLTRNSITGVVEKIASSSIPVTVASNDVSAQTTAQTIVTTTVGASDATYEYGGYLNTTALTASTLILRMTYTDENNSVQTVTMTTVSTVVDQAITTRVLRAKAGSTITISTVFTVGSSATYDAGAFIRKAY